MKDTPEARRERAKQLHEQIRALTDPEIAPENGSPAAPPNENANAFVQRRMAEVNRTASAPKKKVPRAPGR